MSEIKVTDKRMFTPDGRLRAEFEAEVEESGVDAAAAESAPPAPAEPDAAPALASGERGADSESSATDRTAPVERGPGLEIPGTLDGLGAPSFFDLVGALAEPASIYLGEVALPDGSSAENLDAARFHIDLLDLLRKRTAGNLAAQELAVLEDVLYRLRLRYVQKRG